MNKNSEAKIKANNRYRQKKYDSISLVVPKGMKEYYENKATELGYSSLNQFIKDSMDKNIKREDA